MRLDQTDHQTDPGPNTMKPGPDGRNAELSEQQRRDIAEGDPELRDRDLPDRENRAGTRREDGFSANPWQDIKSRFVDDPAGALAAAEELVQSAVEDKVRALKSEAASICAPDRNEDASSTENLRTRLIRYQAYCEHLAGTGRH